MQKLLHILAFAMVAFVAFCMLYLQAFPILHDFPEWMYQSWIFSELLSGDNPAVAERFQLVTFPVPNSLSQIAMGLLNSVVSPVVAGKLWLAFYLVVSSILWFVMSRHASVRFSGAIHLLLTDLITFGPGFWNGYINFQFGLILLAFYVYLIVWRGVRDYRVVFIFATLLYFSHAVVFAVFIVFKLACICSVWRQRMTGLLIALFPTLLLTCWYAAIKLGTADNSSWHGFDPIQWIQYKAYTLAKQGPFHNFIQHDGQSALEAVPVVYQVGFVVNFIVAVLFLIWFIWLVHGLITGRAIAYVCSEGTTSASEFRFPIMMTVFVSVIAFLMGLQNLLGVVNIGERFLIAALLFVLLFVRCPHYIRRSLVAVCAVLSIYTLSVLFTISRHSVEIYSVERSSEINDLQQYLGDIYANTRHKHFNHRLFIYADRGVELTHKTPVLLAIDLPTSVVENRE